MTVAYPRPALSRRGVLAVGGTLGLSVSLPFPSQAFEAPTPPAGDVVMPFITTSDDTQIFYKDWGPRDAQPIVFHHGWPLSADDWDNQMMFFLAQGYRVIAHDRRGHGRSSQTWAGNETANNPGGLPIEVFDGFRAALVANRAQSYRDVPSGPFYGFNRAPASLQEGVVANWWRQGMMGGAKAHYDCIKAFSETDFTEDLKAITVPTLVMHGTDDQIVPIGASARLSAPLLRTAQTKIYDGLGHGLCTINPDVVNPDLLAFIRS